jgi:hypothetical protein
MSYQEPTKIVFTPPKTGKDRTYRDIVEPLLVPGVVIVGLIAYAYFRDDIKKLADDSAKKAGYQDFSDFIDKIFHPEGLKPLPPIKLPLPEPGPGPSPGPIGGGTGFGSPEVSLHGLQSGGSAWRKQWEIHKRYLNCQFQGYFLIPSGSDYISIKLRGGPHTSSSPKEGCCYIISVPHRGGNKNNFSKECPHPVYDKFTVPTQFSLGSIIGKWTGIRAQVFNVSNGVKIRVYLDTENNGNWRLWYDITDTGQYGSGDKKPPFTRSPWNGTNPQAIVRIDANSQSQAQGYQMKNASMSEIGTANIAQVQRLTIA